MTIYRATAQGQVPMTPAEEAAFLAEQAENAARVIVPQTVTMRQARLALLGTALPGGSTLLAKVSDAIASLPSPQKEAAQIEWEYSQEVHRNKALVSVLAPMLGLTDAQIDQLFITAATL